MAETRNGEVDLRFTPGDWSSYRYLNHSRMEQHLAPLSNFNYHSPRYDMSMYIYSGNDCRNLSGFALNDPVWKYLGAHAGDTCAGRATNSRLNCVATHCPHNDSKSGAVVQTVARVFLIDYDRERAMGYGRQWELPKPPQGSLHMLQKLANDLKVSVGDTVRRPRVGMPWSFGHVAGRSSSRSGGGDGGSSCIHFEMFGSDGVFGRRNRCFCM